MDMEKIKYAVQRAGATALVLTALASTSCTSDAGPSFAANQPTTAAELALARIQANWQEPAFQEAAYAARHRSFTAYYESLTTVDGESLSVGGKTFPSLASDLRGSPVLLEKIISLDERYESVDAYLQAAGIGEAQPTLADIDAYYSFAIQFLDQDGLAVGDAPASLALNSDEAAEIVRTAMYMPRFDEDSSPQLGLLQASGQGGSTGSGGLAGAIAAGSQVSLNNSANDLNNALNSIATQTQDNQYPPPASECSYNVATAPNLQNRVKQRGNNWWICQCATPNGVAEQGPLCKWTWLQL